MLHRYLVPLLSTLLFSLGCSAPQIIPAPNLPSSFSIPPADLFNRAESWQFFRNSQNAEVANYIKAENLYTEQVLASQRERNELLREFFSLQDEHQGVEAYSSKYLYWSKKENGLRYPLLMRTSAQTPSDTHSILDQNEIAKSIFASNITLLELSPDENKAALLLTNSEGTHVLISSLPTRSDDALISVSDVIDFAWGNDSHTLFALQQFENLVVVTQFDLEQTASPIEVFTAPLDDGFWHLKRSSDGKVLFLCRERLADSKVFSLSFATVKPQFGLLRDSQHGTHFVMDHSANEFLSLTTTFERSYLEHSSMLNDNKFTVLFKTPTDTFIQSYLASPQTIALVLRKEGKPQMVLFNRSDAAVTTISSPQDVYELNLAQRISEDLPYFITQESGPTKPREDKIIAPRPLEATLPSLFSNDQKRSLGHTELNWASSRDGQRIPILLTLPNDQLLNGIVLYSYGVYGHALELRFRTEREALLKRHIGFAFVEPRGGGLLGSAWHESGRARQKPKSVEDLIDAANYLRANFAPKAIPLILWSRSAGSTLSIAAALKQPNLFSGIIAEAPFIDIEGSLTRRRDILSRQESYEWGDLSSPTALASIRSYAALNTPVPENLPPFLIMASDKDRITGTDEATPLVAKLRASKTQPRIFYRTSDSADHFGPDDSLEFYREQALRYEFILGIVRAAPK